MTDASTTSRPLFNRQQLISLFLPLVAEQALSISIGLADTLMVSSVGEAAVSGVSLVDSFNVLMIQLLSALATGGAGCALLIGMGWNPWLAVLAATGSPNGPRPAPHRSCSL